MRRVKYIYIHRTIVIKCPNVSVFVFRENFLLSPRHYYSSISMNNNIINLKKKNRNPRYHKSKTIKKFFRLYAYNIKVKFDIIIF